MNAGDLFNIVMGFIIGAMFSSICWKSQIKDKAKSLIDIWICGKFYKIRENKKRNKNG